MQCGMLCAQRPRIMKRSAVTVLCLLVAPAAHALVQTKHQTVTATECARAGLPAKFCQQAAVEAYNTDANEFEDLSAHAQIPAGATACDAADQSLLRLLSLGQELRLGLGELRRTGSATAAGRVARALGRGLHTVQDNCAHHGMPNPQHAWFSLSDSCRSTTQSPDVQSDAYVCAARETAAVMAEFRRAADGAGVTSALGRASVGGTHWPPYSQVCDFLGSSGQWSGADQRWENEIVVPALRAQFIAAIGSDGPAPVEACPGGRERLVQRQSRAALDTSGGAQSCISIHLFCLGKADDAGEQMPPWESAETVAEASAEVSVVTGSDGAGNTSGGCSLAGSSADESAIPLALLVVGVAALLLRRRIAALLVAALIG